MQIEAESPAHFRPEVESLNHPETKVGIRMKRYLAIVLLTALVLALCLPIFARYEQCGQCFNGRLIVTEKTSTVRCPTCNKSVTRTAYREVCSNPDCDYDDTTYELSCGHPWN